MAYQTHSNVFIHTGSWSAETRAHPAMSFMEHYTSEFDTKAFQQDPNTLHTPDYSFQKPTGEVADGLEKGWAAAKELYAPFETFRHVPTFCVCWETDSGWEMVGMANLFWNLRVPGEKKVSTEDGAKWEGASPAAFRFKYVKDGKEIKIGRSEVYSDPSAAMVEMLKRGMLKPEQLLG